MQHHNVLCKTSPPPTPMPQSWAPLKCNVSSRGPLWNMYGLSVYIQCVKRRKATNQIGRRRRNVYVHTYICVKVFRAFKAMVLVHTWVVVTLVVKIPKIFLCIWLERITNKYGTSTNAKIIYYLDCTLMIMENLYKQRE